MIFWYLYWFQISKISVGVFRPLFNSCIDLTKLQFYLLTWTDLINPILVDNNVVYSNIGFSYLHIDFYCAATYRVSFLFLLFAIPIYKHYQLSNKNTWFNKLMKDRGRICQTTFFSSVLSGNTGVILWYHFFSFKLFTVVP